MSSEVKNTVRKEDTFDLLDIRVGRIVEVEAVTSTVKPCYKMTIDFGKFGKKVSVGRFTNRPIEEVKNLLVIAVINFEPRQMGEEISEVLVLGLQYPKADSGEATFVSPLADVKIGGKLF